MATFKGETVEKRAVTQHPIHDVLARRWSTRAFSGRKIEPEKIGSLLEAARWAPSSQNGQPWTFLLAFKENQEEFERMLSCLTERNIPWARLASLLVLTTTKVQSDQDRHAYHDLGLAVGNLTAQATALNLFVHQMAGFYPDKARATFGIPAGHEPVTVLAIGYYGSPEELPEDRQKQEVALRVRKPLEQFVFEGGWGRPAALLAKDLAELR